MVSPSRPRRSLGILGRILATHGQHLGAALSRDDLGESHGAAIGAVVDGCPPLLPLTEADIQVDLDRRAPGRARSSTQRKESDTVRILSGVFDGQDARHADQPRDPERGHALGRLPRGAGEVPAEPRRLHLRGEVRHPRLARRRAHERARDRRARRRGRRSRASSSPCAGASTIVAWVSKVGRLVAECDRRRSDAREQVDATPIRCPDPVVAAQMIAAVEAAREGRQLARRRRHLRRARLPRRAGASRCSTGWRPTSPRRC